MIEATFPQVADAFAISMGEFRARAKAARDIRNPPDEHSIPDPDEGRAYTGFSG